VFCPPQARAGPKRDNGDDRRQPAQREVEGNRSTEGVAADDKVAQSFALDVRLDKVGELRDVVRASRGVVSGKIRRNAPRKGCNLMAKHRAGASRAVNEEQPAQAGTSDTGVVPFKWAQPAQSSAP